MNETILNIFKDFEIGGIKIPISFIQYKGTSETYMTFMQTSVSSSLTADNELIGYIDNYDIDIFTKGNFMPIKEAVIKKMTENGFTWQVSMSSPDMYEDDTGYYHKTLNFSIERTYNG